MSQFYGSNLTQLADQYSGDPRRGRAVVRRLHGTPLQILAQANAAAALGLRYEVREMSQGGHHELTVFYGNLDDTGNSPDKNEPLARIWSLRVNELEKNLWDTQKVFEQLSILSASDVALLRVSIERFISGEASGIPILPPGVDSAVINGLIGALSKGIESKSISAPVVALKTVVPPDTELRPDFTGVDKVIQGGNLAAGKDPATGGPIPQNVLWGMREGWYLKKMATVEQTGPTTWEFNQEWWWHGEYYDTFVYEEFGNT